MMKFDWNMMTTQLHLIARAGRKGKKRGIFRTVLVMLCSHSQFCTKVILILSSFGLRGSNKKALLVAGLTVLATLLIAGQAFTAYSVYQHSEKLSMLERRSDRLQEMSVRARGESHHTLTRGLSSVQFVPKWC